MGINFNIIDESGNLIDKYAIKWLVENWDVNFCSKYSNTSMNNIEEYCDEEIIKLKEKKNKLKIILDCWNETNFEKRKKLKINIISLIDEEHEFYSTLEYFSEFDTNKYTTNKITLSKGSKLMTDYDYYSLFISHFVHFKDFIVQYRECKFQINL